jgi:recombination protein RecA
MSQEKQKAIAEAVQKINKKYGSNTVSTLGKGNIKKLEVLSTNCFSLDDVFGCGGLPRGRVIEVFGEASAGKSSLVTYLAGQVQKNGGKVAWIDAECAWNTDYAKNLGVNTEEVFVSQETIMENALDITEQLVLSGGFDLIVIDSVASLVPQKEADGEMSSQDVALQARLMSKALRKITGSISKTKTVVIFINQLREKIGVFFGNPNVTSGGMALKFYSSVRLEVRKSSEKSSIKDSQGNVIGNYLKIKAVKNKVGLPFRECELDLYFEKGIDKCADLFTYSLKHKVITQAGNTYSIGEVKLGVGRDAVIKTIKSDEELFNKINDKCKNLKK